MSQRLRLADLPFALLMGVGVAFVGGLTLVVARSTLPQDPLAACATLVGTVAARLATVGLLAPLAILSAVILATLLALGHQLWATRRMLKRVLGHAVVPPSDVAESAQQAGVGGLDLVADAGVFVFCWGYFRPRICISLGLVDLLAPTELAAVLRHEAHHARHRDPVKILIGRAVASGLFFLPVAGALRNGFLTGKEICADRAAQNSADSMALPRALVKMLHADRPTWPAGVLAIGALSPTEARIYSLLEPEGAHRTLPSALDWVVTLALTAGIFGFSLGSAAAAGEDPGVFEYCSPAAAHVSTLGAPGAFAATLAVLP